MTDDPLPYSTQDSQYSKVAIIGHVKKLILGNGVAQSFQFLSVLVLSRIYLPSDFGLLAQVQSIATVMAIISTLQLHLTIPLSKSAEEAQGITERVQTISFALFAICFFPTIFLGKVTAISMVLALFLGLTNTYSCYLVYQGSFGRISGFYIIRALLIISLQFGFALLPVKDGLLWSTVIAEGLAAIYLRLTQLGSLLTIKIDLHEVLTMVTQQKSFSLYGTLQELVSVFAFYAPLFLFIRKFDTMIGGQYAMTSRLVWAPVVLLSGSVAQVLYYRLGQIRLIPSEMLREIRPSKLMLALVLAIGILSFHFQGLFLLVLGDRWGLASELLPLQVIWGGAFILATSYRVMYRVLHIQRYQLLIDAGMLGSIGLVFLLTSMTPINTMWCIVLIALCQNALLVITVRGILKGFTNKIVLP